VSDPAEIITALTRQVPDFPRPGVLFRDLTPVLADDRGFAVVTEALAEMVAGADLIAGIDARGFLLGGAVAHRLGVGVLAIRKGGKLPPPVHSRSYDLEYGTATLEIPADGVALAGRRVAIVDDEGLDAGREERGEEAVGLVAAADRGNDGGAEAAGDLDGEGGTGADAVSAGAGDGALDEERVVELDRKHSDPIAAVHGNLDARAAGTGCRAAACEAVEVIMCR
jgi:adenine phosphoribosyltransferase